PNFSTVKTPNPEDPLALDMALKRAAKAEADLVLATDPDGDRVGTAVRDKSGEYVILNGNQVGALLVEYICSRLEDTSSMPEDPAMIKTIVTGNLGKRIAESYGLSIIETLTGFKFIGDRIKEFAQRGGPQFVFGYEESCGYLAGTFVRDKDAIIASYLIAEMTGFYQDQGKNLLEILREIQEKHGYHSEDLCTVELKDISEADRHVAAYQDLPGELGGLKIVEKRDYQEGKGWDLLNKKEFVLTLPRSPVLHYTFEDGSWFAVRPSGTEPKVKFYISAVGAGKEETESKLARLKEAILAAS
ncbi:MAG: phospho-sugar mutase, partial [Bacillota bacterium]